MHDSLKRHFLKEKETLQILEDLCKACNVESKELFGSKPRVEVVEKGSEKIFFFNETPFSARIQDRIFPMLTFKEIFPLLPRITVDMGAVRHICAGADIMAPGVAKIDGEFDEGAVLLIADERHGKALAIGLALMDSKTMATCKKGRVVKNVHYVGDKLWNLVKTLT